MRITHDTLSTLAQAMADAQGAIENVTEPLDTWLDLHGATDADSREERREARAEIEDNLDGLVSSVRELALALGIACPQEVA